jgi:flagellar basal body-associated protein FliL
MELEGLDGRDAADSLDPGPAGLGPADREPPSGESPPDEGPLSPKSEPAARNPGDEAHGGQDPDRARFLKSLLDGSEDSVPRKVELDLDGIFDEAKKEAESLSPDSTHPMTEAPLPEEPPVFSDEPAPPPEPLSEPHVRKVSRYKLLFLVVPIAVGLAGLIAAWHIFFRSPPQMEVEQSPLAPAALVEERPPAPGEMTLGKFFLDLGQETGQGLVVEMEIILHYGDAPDALLIDGHMVEIRDLIYRLAKDRGPGILSDPAVRRQLQADLLSTLNALPHFGTGAEPRLTYVQISLMRRM